MAALARRLLEAAAEGDEATARSMAARGAHLNVLSDSGDTALLLAVKGSHGGVAIDLARRGADLEARDPLRGWTALLYAAYRGAQDVACALLQCRADVAAVGKDGETALMMASLLGHTVLAELLIESGAAVDACAEDGKRGLTHACYKGFWATALCLVSHGAELDAPDLGGRAPLSWAAFKGHEEIVRFLTERQADAELRDRLGWTPLMLSAHGGHAAVAACLVERQCDMEALGNDGETALMLAALRGHTSMLQLLARRGAELEAVAKDGMTALRIAAEAGHFDAARMLAEHGAEVPEEGLAVAAEPWEPPSRAAPSRAPAEEAKRRALESPGLGGLALTRRLAEQLLLDFEGVLAARGDQRKLTNAAAERWGFAPTELGYRRLLKVVEEADADALRLKAMLQDAGALPKDPERDGLFDWADMGGIED